MTSAAHAVWMRPSLRDQVLRPRRDGRADMVLAAPALATGWQALRLEQYLSAVAGVTRVDVNTPSRRIRLTFDPAGTDIPRILRACDHAGCAARPLARDALDDANRREADDALKRLLVAGIFAMQAMMFALVLYLDVVDPVDTTTVQLFRWLEMLSATPVVCYAGVPFYRHALADLRARLAGIDVPIALAVGLIFVASTVNTLRGHGEIWFDSASMLIFVLLLGRYLEQRARHRHQAAGSAADHAAPLTATRRRADGTPETVAVAELVPGDRIHVAEGSMVPVDGHLASATARLDTSLHSGESRPETRSRGDAVDAGSLALDGSLELVVTRAGAATSLARLHRLTRDARRRTAPETGDAPAVTGFIVGIVLLAALTLAFWLWKDPSRAFDAAVAVLVVACPCAFALAAPATLTRATELLARLGVRVTRPRALHALARVDRAIFDKTGTLTRPGVTRHALTPRDDISAHETLAAAVALARESSHPLARALADAHAGLDTPRVDDAGVVAGRGIRGTIHGHPFRLGRPHAAGATDDGEALWLEDERGTLARFALAETLRPGAGRVLDDLDRDGIAVRILSGDAPARVETIAARLGITAWQARQSPQDKHRRVLDLQRRGHAVLVVGDGNNDAAALAAADVSASLVDATDLARQQADVLLEGTLDGLPVARRMARRARRTLHQNRAWGLAWNLVAVPFAAAGLVPPWLAALGMSASSLLVVLNVLRMQLPAGTSGTPGLRRLRERTA